ncbi:MAG: undecaprenyl-diphosphate phosphatase [Acidimicrobiales bacterium]|nr:undecaprenyl-diphosphate phosphatase [Acidimicrobiales bacterium]
MSAPLLAIGVVLFLLAGPALAHSVQSTDDTLELTVLEAALIGLVEGVTEYLPVSSTGHILVTSELLGLNSSQQAEDLMDAYAICVQAGAILAVLVVYQQRIRQLLDGLIGRSVEGRQILLAVIAAFIPTAIIGQFIFPVVRDRLFGVGPIALAWIVGGMGILHLSRSRFFARPGKDLHDLTVQNAVVIGLLQTLAMWPGVSRSLITIIAGVLVGLTLRAAVEFSFLLGLITLTAATAYAGLEDGSAMIDAFGWFTPAVGLVVAFVSAVAAVRWMVSYLNTKGFEIFGWYRVAVGLIALAFIGAGALPFSS